MPLLSTVITTFNEERNIARCIQSAQAVSDEVVVLDSFSSDDTVVIAWGLGAMVYQQAFLGYGAQKNAAAALATNNYILFLDADEFLSDELAAGISAEKEAGFPCDAYTMNRLNRYCGRWIRHGSWYPDRKLRLYNRVKGKWTDAIVHEEVKTLSSAKTGFLKGDLLHYAYDSVAQHKLKNQKYSLLSAQAGFESGKRTNGLKVILNPAWAFVRSYLVRLGLLDGKYGFVIAIQIAHLTYLKHSRLLQLQKNAAT